MRQGRPARWLVTAGLVGAAAVAGCSSSHPTTSASVSTPPLSSTLTTLTSSSSPGSSSPTTVAGQLPTVANCGGGAYEPHTLLIVCGVGTTMATGVTWSSWTATSALGTGDVHLTAGGRQVTAPADLRLSDVRNGSTGPQFTILTVTWTGASPDGKPVETYDMTP